jgi:hypothetical protein
MTRKHLILGGGILLAGALAGAAGFSVYWQAAAPESTCASCHEIESAQQSWAQSPHRGIGCSDCHGTVTSAGLHGMREKARFLSAHFGGRLAEGIRLRERQAIEVMQRCRACHAREYADWLSGGHSATYADVFLDQKHNENEQPSESCLRCHGMFFEGSIADVVTPVDVRGPWRLVHAEIAALPAIPCMACHLIHSQGSPALPPDYSDPAVIASRREPRGANVGFYDRYERMHFEAAELPAPPLFYHDARVRLATDVRQRVCVQCHAPDALHRAGTSDDRTPRGVHEGLSCGACHAPHSNDASGSCANCHPQLSNCGLAVDTMDTSYRNPASPHNIHFVACGDCHTQEFLRRHGRAD